MKPWSHPAWSVIGVDVGSRCVKAVQLRRTVSGWRAEAAGILQRETHEPSLTPSEAQQLVGMLKRQGFRGTDVALAAPVQMVLGGILELPSRASGAPVEQIARMEMARMHKRSPDSFELACLDLPAPVRGGATAHVMASACAHEDADKLLGAFDQAELTPVGLDTLTYALTRACASWINQAKEIVGILDLGWSHTRLLVVHQGGVVYERSVPEGGVKSLRDQLMERTGLDPNTLDHLLEHSHNRPDPRGRRAEDQSPPSIPHLSRVLDTYVDRMAQQIGQSFAYASHRYGDTGEGRLVLVGSGACLPGLADQMALATGLSVSPGSLTQLVACAPHLIERYRSPVFAGALGLAMYPKG